MTLDKVLQPLLIARCPVEVQTPSIGLDVLQRRIGDIHLSWIDFLGAQNIRSLYRPD
jgi:hypothetical protein